MYLSRTDNCYQLLLPERLLFLLQVVINSLQIVRQQVALASGTICTQTNSCLLVFENKNMPSELFDTDLVLCGIIQRKRQVFR